MSQFDAMLDGAPSAAPPATSQFDTLMDGTGAPPNPHAIGQVAAQNLGNKPVAAPTPVVPNSMLQNANVNRGITPAMASVPQQYGPNLPEGDEGTFNASDTLPAAAAPVPAQRVQDAATGGMPLNPADVSLIKQAQDAILGKKVADVQAQLPAGSTFDPKTGDDSIYQRFRMGLMSSSVDRAAFLKDHMPAGTDIRVLPGGGTPMVVFKPPGATAYQPVRGQSDLAGKFGDALAAVPPLAAQTAATMGTDGMGLLARARYMAGSGALERGAELLTNHVGGYDNRSIQSDLGDMAGSALTSELGDAGGSILSYGGKTGSSILGGALDKAGASSTITNPLLEKGATIPGMFNPGLEGDKRLAAEKYLKDIDPNVPALLFDQLGNTLAEGRGNRLRAFSPVLAERDAKKGPALADMVSKYVDPVKGATPQIPTLAANGQPGISDVMQQMKQAALAPMASVPDVSPTVGGSALGRIYQNAIAPVVDRTNAKYAQVLDTMSNAPQHENGVVPIDLSGAHSVIDREAAPKFGQGVPQTVETPIMTDIGGRMAQTGTTSEVKPTDVRVGGGIKPGIADFVSSLRSLNPENGVGPMSDKAVAPYEAVGGIRSALSETSQYNPLASGADRATSAQAGRILNPLDTAIETAAGPGATSASLSRQFQRAILDNPKAIAARDTPYPESNMSMLDPQNATFLKNTQRLAAATGQSEAYETAQNAYLNRLKADPSAIESEFKKGLSDPAAFSRMVPPAQQPAVKQVGENIAGLNSSLASKVAGESDITKRAQLIAQSGDMNGAGEIVQHAGGPDSTIGQNVRGAVFQNMMKNSIDPKTGQLSMTSLSKNAGNLLLQDGKDAVLKPEDQELLDHLRTYAHASSNAEDDAGAKLARAAVLKNLLGPENWFPNPSRGLTALAELTEAKVMSHIYAGDRSAIIGRGVSAGPLSRITADTYVTGKHVQNREEPAQQ